MRFDVLRETRSTAAETAALPRIVALVGALKWRRIPTTNFRCGQRTLPVSGWTNGTTWYGVS